MKLCPVTGKPCSKPKSIHVTDIEHNQAVHGMDVCEDCLQLVAKLPKDMPTSEEPATIDDLPKEPLEKSVSPGDPLVKGVVEFMSKLMQALNANEAAKTKLRKDKVCPGCGTAASVVYKTGKFGCPKCYSMFNLDHVLMQLHGATQHVGKVPKKWAEKQLQQKKEAELAGIEDKIEERLSEAIKKEDFEAAAKIKGILNDLDTARKQAEEFGAQLKAAIEAADFVNAAVLEKSMQAAMFRCYEIQESMLDL